MPAVWFDNPVLDAGAIFALTLVLIWVVRRAILGMAEEAKSGAPKPRRPGPAELPPPRVCESADCSAPNRPDAIFCRRCGTRL